LLEETKNRVFKKVDSAAYYKVFSEVLAASTDSFSHPNFISHFYQRNDNEQYFIVNFVVDEELNGA
jgi:hypothetical protein